MFKITIGLLVLIALSSEALGGKRKKQGAAEAEVKPDVQFIDKVHQLSYDIAKETVINDNQVVWSPYSVVNILPLIDGDESLKTSFNTSLTYLQEVEGLSMQRISVAITNRSVTPEDYKTKYLPIPSDPESVVQTVRDTYKKENGIEAPPNLFPEGSLENATEVFLTSLKLSLDWEVPFHYGNSRLSRFYINSTHALKTRFLVNVGYYKYAELEDIDARLVALPLKNAPTMFFVIILPNSPDGLHEVSEVVGQMNVTELFNEAKTKRVYLRLPKIDIDNQLLFTKGTSKIIQTGSIQLTYSGIETPTGKKSQQRIKYKQLKRRGGVNFRVENPFIFMIYETTRAGILNYGEVLIPTDHSVKPKPQYQQNHLSQNGKILSEAVDKLGDDLYLALRRQTTESFAFSPFSLTNLIGSLLPGAIEETKMGILSKLNFPLMWQDALLELNREGQINGTQNRVTVVVNGEPKDSYRGEASKFGATVVSRQSRDFTTSYPVKSILGASDYQINPQFDSDWKKVEGRFYRNEMEFDNVTYVEFRANAFRYLYVPFWDARIISVPLYGHNNQSLLLVVPGERSGLNLIEDGIHDYPVTKLMCQGHVRQTSVRLRIPTLAMDQVTEFGQHLSDLGMPQFQTGDFSGIVDKGTLDRLVQRTVFSLEQSEEDHQTNEETDPEIPSVSTDSAESTSSTSTTTTTTTTEIPFADSKRVERSYKNKNKGYANKHRRSNKLVKIDRPFVFYVQDARIGTVLLGRYVGPQRSQTSSPAPVPVPNPTPMLSESLPVSSPSP